MRSHHALALLLGALATACGGGSSPTAPATPTPPPPPGDLSVVVFYDEDGDGALGAAERVRLPGIGLSVAGQGQTTDGSGRARFSALPQGTVEVTLDPQTLPAYYEGPAAIQLGIPRDTDFNYPLTLPVGSNRPNLYMAFGDSITVGELSEDGRGYVGRLEEMLQAHFGVAEIVNEGVSATRSNRGAERIGERLAIHQPAFTLIFYGVNDYNDFDCRINAPCFTVDSLRFMLQAVKGRSGLPFLATLTPSNTGYDFRAPPFRNVWVEGQNGYIRDLAAEEGAVLVDLHAAFLAFGEPNQSGLLSDHIHPNDRGYQVIADTFFDAILHGRPGAAASGRLRRLGWAGGGAW